MSFTIWIQQQYVFFLGSRAKWVPLQIELKVQDKDQANTNLTSPESDAAGGRGTHRSPSWRGSSPGSRGSRGRRGAGGMFRGGRGRQRGSGRGEHFLQLINMVFSSNYIQDILLPTIILAHSHSEALPWQVKLSGVR